MLKFFLSFFIGTKKVEGCAIVADCTVSNNEIFADCKVTDCD